MNLIVLTKRNTGPDEVNLGILQDPRMPELQELATRLGERLGRCINFAQAFSLAVSAIEEGAVKVPGALWRGDWADARMVEAIAKCVGETAPQDLEAFLADPAFPECEREYQEWKAKQPATPPWPGHEDSPPMAKCDGIGHAPEGLAMYIWADNTLWWKRLARRLSWRLDRKINYIHAFFLYFHARHYTAKDEAWVRRAHCVHRPDVANAIVAHLAMTGPEFLSELLSLPEFYEWEQQHEQALDDGCLPSKHYRMVVTTPMSIGFLTKSGACGRDAEMDARSEVAGSDRVPAKLGRYITVHYSKERDLLDFEDRHVPEWMRLARAIGRRIGRKMNLAHAATVFGWALGAGDLPCFGGQWHGCVHSPEVVEILAEYLAASEPEDLDRLLASKQHKRMAQPHAKQHPYRKRKRRR